MISREEFDQQIQRQYESLLMVVPLDRRMEAHAVRLAWVDAQWKIFQAVGGTWVAVFQWANLVNNVITNFYMREFFECETQVQLGDLVRRSFREFWKIDLTKEEEMAMQVMAEFMPDYAAMYHRHLAKLK